MKIVKKDFYIVSQKIIPSIDPQIAALYDVPKDHKSMVYFSATNDDPCYLALDDVTKKVDIKVLYVKAMYGGQVCAESKLAGSVFCAFSAPTVEKAKSAMAYIKDFVENHSDGYNIDDNPEYVLYAQCIPKMGKYYSELLGVPEGTSYAYLLGSPIESCYALDRALKSADVKLARLFQLPAMMNSGGGIVVGKESAVKTARNAFIEAMIYATKHLVNGIESI